MPLILTTNILGETSTVLRIRGPDAYTYLQGQFTQDLNRPPGTVAYGLWLNQRGKVVADSFVLRRAEHDFLIVGFTAPTGLLRGRLESYLVADEVEVADETGEWTRHSLWGPGAGANLNPVFGYTPAPGFFAEGPAGLAFHGRLSSGVNLEWLAPRAAAAELAGKLAGADVRPGERPVAEWARITSGIPAVPADLGPGDLPNEGGLEDTALSHTKGCYLGQEVMARLKNLGQVRRRLHLVRGPGAAPPPQTVLFQGGRKIGETRSAAPDDGGFVAMAMLTLMNLDSSSGVATTADGPPNVQIVRCV